MEAWSYPLGKFRPEEQPTSSHREGWIKDIVQIPNKLRSTLQSLNPEQLLTPYRPGGWNAQQVVHHLADNDMNAYIRFKRALTEEAPIVGSYREELWAELSDYQDTPIENSLVLLDWSRCTNDLPFCCARYHRTNSSDLLQVQLTA